MIDRHTTEGPNTTAVDFIKTPPLADFVLLRTTEAFSYTGAWSAG
jgi:hypothetical protein